MIGCKELAAYNGKKVRVISTDGQEYAGRGYVETWLDDDDELRMDIMINFIGIEREEIASIEVIE